MTGALALLSVLVALAGYVAGLKRKASRERDARVRAEIARDQARGEADVARATAAVTAAAAERKADAVATGAEVRAEIVDLAGPTPTPEAVIAAADEARRKRATNVKRKIAAGKGGRK